MAISMKTTSGKLLASAALPAAAAGVAGMGTYGTFTSSTQADQQVDTGEVNISLTSDAANDITVPVTDVLPGDTIQRLVTLTNDGQTTSA